MLLLQPLKERVSLHINSSTSVCSLRVTGSFVIVLLEMAVTVFFILKERM